MPAVRFTSQAPALPEPLPRMDVAAFVGFAAAGPLHVPVAIEDPGDFAALFGDDAPLAWDPVAGQARRAYLAPAVRAFFRNGGERCWVVRVAGAAQTDQVAIAGLIEHDPLSGETRPAFARARSAGAWADTLRVASALAARPVMARSVELTADGAVLALALRTVGEVAIGDLLRFDFGDRWLYATVAATDDDRATRAVRVRCAAPRWLYRGAPATLPTTLHARRFLPDGEDTPLAIIELQFGAGDTVTATLAVALADAPPPGTSLRVDLDLETLWLTAGAARAGDAGTELRCTGMRLGPAPAVLPTGTPVVERLRFELAVQHDDAPPVRLTELGFAPAHPRYWGALPDDADLYGATRVDPARDELRRAAQVPRFALAGAGVAGVSYLPIAMPAQLTSWLAPIVPPGRPLERDGLAEPDERLFVDARLVDARTDALLGEADFLRLESAVALTGIHALLAIDEVSLIAVPDALHAGWQLGALPDAPPPAPPDALPVVTTGDFVACALRPPPAAPVLTPARLTLAPGETFTLAWDGPAGDHELEEATTADWLTSAPIYRGPHARRTLYGRPAGVYYYRVRVTVDGVTSAWSAGATAIVRDATGYAIVDDPARAHRTSRAVQRALMRMCAARGDLLAILSLPAGAREDDVLDHLGRLKASDDADLGALGVPALARAETTAFSYAALYHPWTVTLEEATSQVLREAPPDGAAVGMIARRARERGAWIAPANEPIRDVLAVVPPVSPRGVAVLQQLQVNTFHQQPRGFLALSADTLADDPALWPISVRRLLGLLKRVVVRAGADWTFEPHGAALRRGVTRDLEALLSGLFARGAFAGAGSAEAYRVRVDDTINPPASVDLGRFIVELEVAPSQPLEFLTVRLVQTGDRGTVTEVR